MNFLRGDWMGEVLPLAFGRKVYLSAVRSHPAFFGTFFPAGLIANLDGPYQKFGHHVSRGRGNPKPGTCIFGRRIVSPFPCTAGSQIGPPCGWYWSRAAHAPQHLEVRTSRHRPEARCRTFARLLEDPIGALQMHSRALSTALCSFCPKRVRARSVPDGRHTGL